jgi:hypothetical protein
MAKSPSRAAQASVREPDAAAATAPPAATPERPEFRYEDRPDLLETFADNVQRMTFDGRTLRIEFCVNRAGELVNGQQTGRSMPVCRMVLDLDGAIDLFNKINSLQTVLERQGVIRKNA